MGRLPETPSALIRVAVKNMEAVEKSPLYKVDMENAWHRPDPLGVKPCAVCFAGGTMAMSLDADITKEMIPGMFGDDDYKLWALDSFRVGEVSCGFQLMGLSKAPIDDFDVCLYKDEPTMFKQDMRWMVDELEAAGL